MIRVADPVTTVVSNRLETTDHNSYMAGMGNKTFAPNASVTRAQVVQMFYNLLKDKNVDVTVNFDDVDENAWYAKAVNTLGSMGIVAGVGENKFDPERPITRAQAATIVNAMLKRFADKDYVKVNIQNPYNDVTDAHWAFYQIMEASVAHDHDYDEDGTEFWDGLK